MANTPPVRLKLFGTVASVDSNGRGRFLMRDHYDFADTPRSLRDGSAWRLRAALPIGKPLANDPAVQAGLISDSGVSAAGMPYRIYTDETRDGVRGEFWVVLSSDPARRKYWTDELHRLATVVVVVEASPRRFFFPASELAPARAGVSLDLFWLRPATSADVIAANTVEVPQPEEPTPLPLARPLSAAMRARAEARAAAKSKLNSPN